MRFTTWLDTLIEEKGYDPEHRFTVEGPSGPNSIPLGCTGQPILTEDSDARTLLAWLRATDSFPSYEADSLDAMWAEVACVLEATS